MKPNHRPFTPAALLAAALLACGPALAQEKVLRIAMTAADIPRTLGQPDQGFEGNRFTGIPMYDSLTQWDLSKADAPSVLIPALATSWAVDPKDKTKWVFKLRNDVKFHDGRPINLCTLVFAFRRLIVEEDDRFLLDAVAASKHRSLVWRLYRSISSLLSPSRCRRSTT